LARKARGERVFRTLKPKLMRKRIPVAETAFGVVFLALLAIATGWILSQRDNFDPGERDVSFEVLQQSSVEDTLYRTPIKRWAEPGSAGAVTAGINLGIFPDGLLDGGWELDGRVETYDPANLYEKINGAAEQYLAFGFRELHYATLARDDSFLTVELYDQGGFGNALGIFAAQRDTSKEVLRQGPIYYYPTPAGAVGGYENYYFKIAGDSTSAAITGKSKELIGLLALVPTTTGGAPFAYAVFTKTLGLGLDRIAYQRSDVFQFEFLSDFWFGAVGGGSEARYFIHEAADANAARSLFSKLVDEQVLDYAVLERGEDRAVLQHEYLKTVFAVRQRGNLIIGVDGAESSERSHEFLRRLDEVTQLETETGPTS
jgi:hypothetical protein